MNKVFLLGNLAEDSELRFTQGGQAVLNFRMATAESWSDKDDGRKEHTEWHSVVVWGKRAEALEGYLLKGSKVLVEGKLRTSSYEDKEGIKRYKTEVHADELKLCVGPGRRPLRSQGCKPLVVVARQGREPRGAALTARVPSIEDARLVSGVVERLIRSLSRSARRSTARGARGDGAPGRSATHARGDRRRRASAARRPREAARATAATPLSSGAACGIVRAAGPAEPHPALRGPTDTSTQGLRIHEAQH